MGSVTRFAAAVGFAGAAAALCAFPAEAGCKRMAFSVNDYGKDGPTKDSQDLLDKHIATWAAEQGIEKYTVGKKDVSCELFLNLIVVDEHTCTARATVCWGGDKLPGSGTQEAKKKDAEKTAAKADAAGDGVCRRQAREKAEGRQARRREAGGSHASPRHRRATTSPATAPQVETGALPLTNKPADDSHLRRAAQKRREARRAILFSVSERDAVAAAAAAAERAAAAAERAAAAAERAAAAATEANAARAQAVEQQLRTSTGSGAAPSRPPLARQASPSWPRSSPSASPKQ